LLTNINNNIDNEIEYLSLILNEFESSVTNEIQSIDNELTVISEDITNNHQEVKNYFLEEAEQPMDYIVMVANDTHFARVEGDQLILRFIPVVEFPKIKSTTPHWQVQIPYPKESFTWADFDPIRWWRGDRFCYMNLYDPDGKEIRQAISGYFRSKEDADIYFSSLLGLTQCTERRKGYSDITNKKIIPSVVETRVHRAFVTYIDYPQGKAIAKQCYKPE
jgi:hypothetical protein